MNSGVNQSQFRTCVQKRDRKCIITRYDQCECDACHIIPYSICNGSEWPFKYDRRNGLFLTKSLHALFDQFLWTFDIYDLKYENNKYYSRVIVIDNNRNLFIDSFKNQYIAFPTECLPFLYAHYQMYILYNYEQSLSNNIDIAQKYHEIVTEDIVFKLLIEKRIPMDVLLGKKLKEYLVYHKLVEIDFNDFYVNAILKNKNTRSQPDKYLVWWDYLPMSEASWESKNNLQDYSVNFYHDKLEDKRDPPYIAYN